MSTVKKKSITDDQAHEYNDIVERSVLVSVALKELNYDVSDEYSAGSADGGRVVPYVYSVDFEGCDFSVIEGCAVLDIRWKLVVTKDERPMLRAEARYRVIYEGFEGKSEEMVALFAKKAAVFSAYPYFRAMIAQLGWASEVYLPILPVLK